MKIDFSQEISIHGVKARFSEGKDAILGDACRIALNAQAEGERLTLEESVKRGRLALKIAVGGEIEISPEDVSTIRRCLPNAFPSPELIVTVYDMLDPRTEERDGKSP